jgi:16S rRNA processing protein RimM
VQAAPAAPAAPAPAASAPVPDGLVELGYVARAHGLHGEITVITHDPGSTTLDTTPAIWIAGRRWPIESVRDTQRGWLVVLAGVDNRTAAEALRGNPVWVSRDDIPLDDGEVLLADLVGCRAQLADGTPWGEIVAVEMSGPQYRLVVHHEGVERELPVVDALVPHVDLDARLVTVAPPEDLPEQPAEPRRGGRRQPPR